MLKIIVLQYVLNNTHHSKLYQLILNVYMCYLVTESDDEYANDSHSNILSVTLMNKHLRHLMACMDEQTNSFQRVV